MKGRSILITSLAVAVAILGCSTDQDLRISRTLPGGQTTTDLVAARLTKSISFQQMRKRTPDADYVVDGESDEWVVVGIGETKATHFTRWETLRLMKATADVFKLETDARGNETWVRDSR